MSKQSHSPAQPKPFSQNLESWLKSGKDTTLDGLIDVFAEKSFAILFILLLSISALPIPTGGLTHVFQVIAALICLQLIAGRSTIWLPNKWRKLDVKKIVKGKAAGKLISVIKWFERYSSRRLGAALELQPVLSTIGLIILVLTVAAFVAPPFSGLDTLPSMGVLIISLGLILEDSSFVVAGTLVGAFGIGLEIAAGTALYSGITHFF